MLRYTIAIVTILVTSPVHAAPDRHSLLEDTGIGQREIGVGAQVGITIKLGSDRVVRKSDRVQLDFAGGPVAVMFDHNAQGGIRRGHASLVGLQVKLGYSTSLNFSGQPLVVNYTRLGAVERDVLKVDKPKAGLSSGATIGIGVGAVAVLGFYLLATGGFSGPTD